MVGKWLAGHKTKEEEEEKDLHSPWDSEYGGIELRRVHSGRCV
jgi:hypothetical protein